MNTNTNASNGASNKSQIGKREVRVSVVRDAEIDRHIRSFTGSDDKRLVVDYAIHNVTHINTKDSGMPAGSNVNIDSTGKQTTEELEKGNAVTLIARDVSTLNNENKKIPKDIKNSDKDRNEAEEK